MGLLVAAILLAQGQVPNVPHAPGESATQAPSADFLARRSAANNKFRKFLDGAKTLSVQIEVKQDGVPDVGHAVFILSRPGNLYYHFKWGKNEYTYAIDHGKATEID